MAKTVITAPLGRPSEQDTYPLVNAKDIGGGIHVFSSISQRDAMPVDLKTAEDTVALVGRGENNYPSWYKWESGQWNFAGYFGGLVIADVDGALTRVDSTAVLGPDFQLQAAGDTGNGVLIMLSDAVKAEIAKKATPASSLFAKVLPPLQIDKGSLFIKPDAFEPHRAEGYLAYFDMDEVILGGAVPAAGRRKGAIWADSVAWGSNNVDLYAERDTKSVILQESDGKDPNVTGGVPILCGLHIAFYGKAVQDGTIECKLVDAMTGDILEDTSGQPIGVIHHYKQGDELKPLTALQVYMAKGAVKATWIPSHTFTEDHIRLEDWATGGSCMMFQQLVDGDALSPVLNEFQAVVGKPIKVMRKYYGVSVAGNKWALSFPEKQQDIKAGAGYDSIIGVDFENPTDVKVAVENGLINIKDTGKLGLFNVAVELSEEDTRNLRGKVVTVKTEVLNRLSATNLCMFVYTGNLKDVSRPVLKGMLNDQYVLGDGWAKHDSAFLAEQPEGGFHLIEKDFVIPNTAGLVMFGVAPVEEQSPMDVSVKPIEVDVKTPFNSYAISLSYVSDQLKYQIANSQFVTYLKIWAIDPTKTNLPFGERPSTVGKAPVKLFADEDDGNAYKGGIILEDITDYKVEIWLNVANYFKTKLGSDETLRFWVEDEAGDVITDSEASLVLKDGDFVAHLVNWHFDYTTVKQGAKLRLFGQSSSKKVGFLINGTYSAAGVSVDAKIVP